MQRAHAEAIAELATAVLSTRAGLENAPNVEARLYDLAGGMFGVEFTTPFVHPDGGEIVSLMLASDDEGHVCAWYQTARGMQFDPTTGAEQEGDEAYLMSFSETDYAECVMWGVSQAICNLHPLSALRLCDLPMHPASPDCDTCDRVACAERNWPADFCPDHHAE